VTEGNPGYHAIDILPADGKCAISVLPSEETIADNVVDLRGGTGLEFAHYIGEAMGSNETGKNVNVIGGSPDGAKARRCPGGAQASSPG
jgi:NADPH-dependent glutamate synthase beta subunit-like oxidoreductase